jgi:RES domain-containing protein
MHLYRVSKNEHADELDGKGSAIAGGRWNRRGVPSLYAGQSRSLALLEVLVHCSRIEDLDGRVIITIEVPDNDISVIETHDLPAGWNSIPWNDGTVEKGSSWLLSKKGLMLQLPSVVVPAEKIYMINPAHPEHPKIRIVEKETFSLDPRLLHILRSNKK